MTRRNSCTGRFATTPTLLRPLSFVLPLPPNRANARGHWRVQHKAKMAYWWLLDAEIYQQRIPQPPRDPMLRASISLSLFVYSLMDTDNAAGRAKWTVDWLVNRGYLISDKPSSLTYAGMPTQVIDRKRPRLEITLTPITEPA